MIRRSCYRARRSGLVSFCNGTETKSPAKWIVSWIRSISLNELRRCRDSPRIQSVTSTSNRRGHNWPEAFARIASAQSLRLSLTRLTLNTHQGFHRMAHGIDLLLRYRTRPLFFGISFACILLAGPFSFAHATPSRGTVQSRLAAQNQLFREQWNSDLERSGADGRCNPDSAAGCRAAQRSANLASQFECRSSGRSASRTL